MAGASHATPSVSRIEGEIIIELTYEAPKGQTAFAVSRNGDDVTIEQEWELPSGERLIPYTPGNNLIAHRCVLLPAAPSPYLGKETLLADIAAFLHRYVDLSPGFEQVAAHYVLLTWVYDAFSEVPYLRFRGDYGTGKTRALIAIGSICYKPFFAAGVSTVSPIFHTLDRFRGTLVLDEADLRFSDATADLVKLLNNGNVRGLPVLRTMQNRQKEFNPIAFNVFGPKIIAMRGSFDDPALESRFITEATGLQPLRKDIPLHVPDSLHEEALALRNRLLDFRLRERLAIQPDAQAVVPGLDPRLNQIALPLLSLVSDPFVCTEMVARLQEEQERIWSERQQTVEYLLVQAALSAFLHASGPDISVQKIANEYNRLAPSGSGHAEISARRVGAVLRKTFRIATRKSHGVYVVSRADKGKLEAVARRLGSPS